MCSRIQCKTCGKADWRGCGAHVDEVMAGVPQAARCTCRSAPTSNRPPNEKRTTLVNGQMKRLAVWSVAAMTLGLAPVFPEPHVVGKLRWVAGGAVGMHAMDWLDLAMHVTPWVGLLAAVFLALRNAGRVPASSGRKDMA